MGYYVTITDVDFVIPDTEEVLAALRDLNKRDDLKHGGVYTGGEMKERWFSWMPPKWEEFENVADIFGEKGLGFTVDYYKNEEEDGSITKEVIVTYYDNKIGQEELFLSVVAPFMRPGSFIAWRGEDGAMWRDYVGIDGKLYRQDAEIKWVNPVEVTV